MSIDPATVVSADLTRPARSLRGNITWTALGNVVYAACQWGMLVVLARLGSPEAVGQYAFALAVTAPVFLFSGMSLRTVQATDVRGRFKFTDYVGLRVVMTLLSLGAVGVVIGAAGYASDVAVTVFVVALTKGAGAVADAFHALFQRHLRMKLIALSMVLNGVASLSAMAALFYLTGSVAWAAFGVLAATVAVVLVHNVPVGRRLLERLAQTNRSPNGSSNYLFPNSEQAGPPRFRRLAELAWVALPLGLSAGLVSLALNMPRYAIEHSFGQASLGIFAALAYFMVAGNTVVGALAQAALPVLADQYAHADAVAFRALMVRLISVGCALGAAAITLAVVAGSAALGLLYPPEYVDHAGALVWLVVAMAFGFVGWFLDYGISAARRFRMQFLISAALLAFITVGSLVVIPKYGILGAAWVVAAALAFQTLLRLAGFGWIAISMKQADHERGN